MRITILLIVTNLVLIGILWVTFQRYKVVEKLTRRMIFEKRTPFQESFKQNRNFVYYREVFRVYPERKRNGVIMGDSQVSGLSWSELIPERDVAAQGIPGDTSAGLLFRISDCYRLQPNWVALLIGTNDVLQGQSADITVDNLKAITRAVRESMPDTHVLIISAPPFARWVEASRRRNKQISSIATELEIFAKEIPYIHWIDLKTHISDKDGNLRPDMTSDGVHLNAKAYLLVKTKLIDCLEAIEGS